MTHTTATGGTRPFRFGVVVPLTTDLPTRRDWVRRIADSGYSTLLMPDVPQWQPAPGPTLAVAAALADLRGGHVGVCLPAAPGLEHRMGSALAVGAHRRSLRDGRRHRQAWIEDALRELGLPALPSAERLARVRETVKRRETSTAPTFTRPW